MQRVAFVMNKVLSEVCPALALGASIRASWRDVVGSGLCKLSELADIRLLRGSGLIVFVDVLSSAAVLLKYNLPLIAHNIAEITGKQNVRVVIHQTMFLRSSLENAA